MLNGKPDDRDFFATLCITSVGRYINSLNGACGCKFSTHDIVQARHTASVISPQYSM